jgi:uncharacterized membrane protein YvbJ
MLQDLIVKNPMMAMAVMAVLVIIIIVQFMYAKRTWPFDKQDKLLAAVENI